MGRKVLVADDEPSIATALEFLLHRSGYEVCVARNGEEALQLIEQTLPDLVLLDVMMPLRSGYEVCRVLRQREEWKHIKVILLTAKGQEADQKKGLALGADLYVTKPFSTRDLVTEVNRLLGGSPQVIDVATQYPSRKQEL